MYDETISQRNSMQPPYLAYDSDSDVIPVTAQEIKQACKEREKLQNVHRNDGLMDLWKEIV